MAAQKKIIDTKLQVRVENTDAAKKAIKNLNYNQIKLTATEAQLLEAGTAIAGLTQYTLSGIRVIDTSELADATSQPLFVRFCHTKQWA